jgi:hypothetical protein
MPAHVPSGVLSGQARRTGLWLTAAGLALLLGATVAVSVLLRAPLAGQGGVRVATAAEAPDPAAAGQTLVATPATARPALTDLATLLRGILICGLFAAVGAALLVFGVGRLWDRRRQAAREGSDHGPTGL